MDMLVLEQMTTKGVTGFDLGSQGKGSEPWSPEPR